jgi:hypothetical protein
LLLLDFRLPPRGLDTSAASAFAEDSLRKSPFPGAAQSGAVAVEGALVPLTPDALAAALLSLPPADRTRLAAVLCDGKEVQHG